MTAPLRVLAVDYSSGGAKTLLGAYADVRSVSPIGESDFDISNLPGNFPRLADILKIVENDGWSAECVLVMFVESFPAPDGLFETDLPIVCFTSDWHLAFSRLVNHLRLYDGVLIDPIGARTFSKRGLTNCIPIPVYSARTELYGDGPGITERPIDIGFAGNLERLIQYERAPWIQRLIELAKRGVTVKVGHGLWGDQYVEFMRSCKITFNRTIRSEVNIRCYEALAAGSVLMVERENEDVAGTFEDSVEYVSYGDFDFEETVMDLLGNTERLGSIARRGHSRLLESESLESHSRKWVDTIRLLKGSAKSVSTEGEAGIVDQQMYMERFILIPERFPADELCSRRLSDISSRTPQMANAMGNRLARSLVLESKNPDSGAEISGHPWFQAAIDLFTLASGDGRWIVPRVNELAFRCRCRQWDQVVGGGAQLLAGICDCSDAGALEGAMLDATFRHEVVHLEREKVLAGFGRDTQEGYLRGLTDITSCIVHLICADANENLGRTAEALESLNAADRFLPDHVTVASERIAALTYSVLGPALGPSEPISDPTEVVADLCLKSCEKVLGTSMLAAESFVTMAFRINVALGRFGPARDILQRYHDATSCVVGDGYRQAVATAWGELRSTAKLWGLEELFSPEFGSTYLG